MFTPHHVSHVTCHMTQVMCLMIFFSLFFLFFFQSGGARWSRVCNQQGPPRLVLISKRRDVWLSGTGPVPSLQLNANVVVYFSFIYLNWLVLVQFTWSSRPKKKNIQHKQLFKHPNIASIYCRIFFNLILIKYLAIPDQLAF